MANRIQFRRDSAINWTTANPVLAQGELGYETDSNKFKIGDGSTAWASLSYFSGGGDATSGSGSSLVNVFPQQVIYDNNSGLFKDPVYELNSRYMGRYEEICFIPGYSKTKMVDEKDNLYFTIDRIKKNTSDKYRIYYNRRFSRQNDWRLKTDKKLYCWKYNINSEGTTTEEDTAYSYFYTESDYASVQALIDADPIFYVFGSREDDLDESIVTSNWATCFEALYYNGDVVSDWITTNRIVGRYPKYDIESGINTGGSSSYLDLMVCKTYIKSGSLYYFWSHDWSSSSSTVYSAVSAGLPVANTIPTTFTDSSTFSSIGTVGSITDYTPGTKRTDLNYLHMKNTIANYVTHWINRREGAATSSSGQSHYNVYFWDYPIMPVRLSQCEVLITDQLGDGSTGYAPKTWVKFDTLLSTEPGVQQWNLMKQPIFRIPYNSYYLWMRFSGLQKVCYYCGYSPLSSYSTNLYRKNNMLSMADEGEGNKWDAFLQYHRFGSKLKYRHQYNDSSVFCVISEYVKFNLVTADDIIHNKKVGGEINRKLVLVRKGCRSGIL